MGLYVGRFAPSPTGPLHFGSLVAAVGSYLQARSEGGRWLVRIEDLDPPREVPGAARDILCGLERLGLHWDGTVIYQSTRAAHYDEALAALAAAGVVYECSCSRKDAVTANHTGDAGTVYPGTCRSGARGAGLPTATRLRTRPVTVEIVDRLQGPFAQQIERDAGDFVLRRRDGWYAYQLAAVVDDQLQGVTEVVRGSDLLDSTPRQWYLQHLLGFAHPNYVHLPIALDAAGRKLSKQSGAQPVTHVTAARALHAALEFLNQDAPSELQRESTVEPLLSWAVTNWRLQRLRGVRSRPALNAMFARSSDGN